MKTPIEEADLKKQLLSLFVEVDTCFAHTDEQRKYCDNNCEGYGCPVWEETANKIITIAEAYYRAKFLSERPDLKELREANEEIKRLRLSLESMGEEMVKFAKFVDVYVENLSRNTD